MRGEQLDETFLIERFILWKSFDSGFILLLGPIEFMGAEKEKVAGQQMTIGMLLLVRHLLNDGVQILAPIEQEVVTS